jgi:uncharacterized Zn-finger protein
MFSAKDTVAAAGAAVQAVDAGARGKESSGEEAIEVSRGQLPHYCPPPGKALWDAHPRIYLPLAESGESRCPYCGTFYRLVEGKK